MKKSIKELRQKTKEIVDIVNQGEAVVITYRGKEVVVILPVDGVKTKDPIGFGMWKDYHAVKNSAKYVSQLREGRFK